MPTRFSPIPRLAALAAGLLAFPIPVSGQTAADRLGLQALRDTLPSVSEPQVLEQLGEWKINSNTKRIRQALVLLRKGSLGNSRKSYDDALLKVERSIDVQSKWPWGWYTLGLIDLAMADQRFLYKSTPYHASGLSYRETAVMAFSKAIEADSTFLPAVDVLSQLILAQGHKLLPTVAIPGLRRAAYREGAPAIAALALQRLEMQEKGNQAGVDLAGLFLRRGGDSAIGRLEQARALRAIGQTDEALTAYYAGLVIPSDAGRAEYRSDLAWTATEQEIEEFDTLSVSMLPGWITRFWEERDALALRRPGERLAEHLRRWVYAHQNYLMHRFPDQPHANAEGISLSDQENYGNFDPVRAIVLNDLNSSLPGFKTYRREQWELDDRGVIYLRHGEPTRVAINPSGPPNESWQYDVPEGSLIFHFLGSKALGTQAPTTLVAALPLDPQMLDSRGNLDSRYTAMGADLERKLAQVITVKDQDQNHPVDLRGLWDQRPGSAAASVQTGLQAGGGVISRFRPEVAYQEITRGRRAIAIGVSTDAFPLRFKRDLGAITQVYGMGIDQVEHSRIIATFAIPAGNLRPGPRSDGGPGLSYPLSIRLIAMDREQGIIETLDTTRNFVAQDTLRGNRHLMGLLELPVPPGHYQVRLLITSPGVDAATGSGRDSVEISLPEPTLVISDLILGNQNSGLAWTYGGEPRQLNPLNAFHAGDDATLFYELGGLRAGVSYEVNTSVRKANSDPAGEPDVRSGFIVPATTAYQLVSREVGLVNLKPGAYQLEVTVTQEGTTNRVTRRRSLNILAK